MPESEGDPTTDLRIEHVEWSVEGEQWIGVFYPGYLHIFRTHVNGLRELARRRLRQHSAGAELGPLDCRLESVLQTRRQSLQMPDSSELEMLIPVANRLATLQGCLPETGGIVVLNGWPDRYLWGTVALDVCQAINASLIAWWRGEVIDGIAYPGERVMELWHKQHDWLKTQIVDPLSPAPVDGA